MDKQLVGELPDITESSNDDEIMVITDSQHNQLRKEKISNFIKDLVSNDENNGIKLGTDNKLLSVDASNADNITSGILNPERLPNSGVTEDTYVYPDSITVDKKGRVTKITNGTPGGNNADKDLSNITEAGKDVIRNTAGSGFSLFDVVEKDHILSFEESMGFGLLGTYVYKEPVAGSRYGYPDFYNECVAQKSTEGNTLLALKNNVEVVGSPVVNNGVLSGFSTSSYATTLTFPTDEDFDFQFKIKTGADISGEQEIFACPTASGPSQYYFCLVNLESNNLNVIFNGGLGVWQYPFGTPAQPETDYIVKVVYSKTNNTLHVTMSLANGTVLLDDTKQVDELYDIKEAVIGTGKDNAVTIFNPFKGSVDLKECYIESNGQRIWSGATTATKNPNGHIFYDIADKATVDEIFSQRGEAWFYGVDTENERVFLPRGTRSQYTVNTDETGDYVEAGLPNIAAKASIGFSDDNPTSDLPPFVFDSVAGNSSGGPSGEKRFKFDASTVNTIYGNSDTVQPYATKKLLYIVVGNVKVQSAASDVVDVTTTENDTVPLFTGQYFNFKPNNPSWLKAGEQQDSGGLYASTYSTLVHELTDPVYNLKVIKTEDMQAGVDYSLYWKVDQDAQTFTTPTKLGNEGMFSTACKGNGVTLGLTNGSNSYGFGYSTNAANYNQTNSGLYGTPIGTQISGQPNNWPYNSSLGITPDPTKSGIVPHIEVPESWNLYFKVANAVENLDMLNAGEILEELSNKTDKLQAATASMPSSKRIELILGQSGQLYQLPADGYLCVNKLATASNQHVFMQNRANDALDIIAISPIAGYTCCVWCMGKKGDFIQVDYSAGGTLYDFCFVYAEGAQ
ncbi:predicted protein [Clostridium sp. CAG:306]|nr:predicted protein [Clostridium sp. CAG:306]